MVGVLMYRKFIQAAQVRQAHDVAREATLIEVDLILGNLTGWWRWSGWWPAFKLVAAEMVDRRRISFKEFIFFGLELIQGCKQFLGLNPTFVASQVFGTIA